MSVNLAQLLWSVGAGPTLLQSLTGLLTNTVKISGSLWAGCKAQSLLKVMET